MMGCSRLWTDVVHCSELVSQIQSCGRKSLLVLKPLDLTVLLPSILNMASAMDNPISARVRIKNSWPEGLPLVEVDRVQLLKGLRNLIQNAYEAMPKGGTLRIGAQEMNMTRDSCHHIRDATPGRKVRMWISDTGVGIRTEHLSQVMDPFFTTHGRAIARGMGLPMIQGIMAQHGGWMEIHSEVGTGTSIDLYFPVAAIAEDLLPIKSQTTTLVMPAAEVGRLLVADDDPLICEVVKTVFQSEEWVVDEAENFDGACCLCLDQQRQPYDLVVLDVTMPGPKVEKVIEKIQTRNPKTQVLLMSGFLQNERVDSMIQRKGVDFIPKPFSAKEILQKVDQMLALPTMEKTSPRSIP